ncbi:Glycine/betaine ABC transporter ATP-binding protein [Streptococcus agalactiae]|nr:Glycine/betaine ABC transporter ATP-binding protein [Streptococcus agalactiae]ANI28080.1 glycine/betaine ABC transporter ATP-binding protein [Streptococcus agalactiae]APO42509.1 glycine/betaine ABC transporter ATP-binding protein [Streptococcus agalactiae]AUO81208.1 Glycine/betaine ABC transporter ATP-binding protein [Streptococcus agalactiae]AUO82802.1 Glycine/betaine ABC transporter ATP-binding protein [Streptococcus agalactiae]
MISFENVSKSYGDHTIIDNISCHIQRGEFFVLVGASGSGKTTILKMINRLIEPSQGAITLDGENITSLDLRQLRLETGYVLQQIALFPNLTVGENIELIPEMKGWSKGEQKKAASDLLVKVGLPAKDYFNRYPHELSGGEQQRIGILRAIVAKPKVLLMDEPFSALDPISRRQLQDITKQLQSELGITLVFVTHDMKEAMRLADRICVIKEAKIVQLDRPEIIQNNPSDQFVRTLFEEEN